VLRLKKNLYGQKQAGWVWNQYLHDGLLARGFKQSKVDMCVYYFESVVVMIYVDDRRAHGVICHTVFMLQRGMPVIPRNPMLML